MAAIIGTLLLILYAASLGAASVLTWRYARARYGWLPGALTAVYYLLSVLFPHPVLTALFSGAQYPTGDALRGGTSTLALVVSLYLLGRMLKEREK